LQGENLKRKEKKKQPICNNCLCFDRERELCKVVIVINNSRFNLPVSPGDRCHLDELGIPVQQVRWWVEDENGNPTGGHGKVKIEYPEKGFFPENINVDDLRPQESVIPPPPEKPPLPPEHTENT
jgi:hypothetical protein